MSDDAPVVPAVSGRRGRSSLTRRILGIAAVWIGVLLLFGGFALDRALTRTLVSNFDSQLESILNGMLAASEIGPDGEVRTIAIVEEELIRFALRFYRGQMSEVARRLGIGRSTLYRKLKDYGIDPDDPMRVRELETF